MCLLMTRGRGRGCRGWEVGRWVYIMYIMYSIIYEKERKRCKSGKSKRVAWCEIVPNIHR